MPTPLAEALVLLFYIYTTIGLLLLPWWHLRGLARLDTGAGHGSRWFRLFISPGLVALWPFLLPAAWRGTGAPLPERNAHRQRAAVQPPLS